jgi:hypothetical protein
MSVETPFEARTLPRSRSPVHGEHGYEKREVPRDAGSELVIVRARRSFSGPARGRESPLQVESIGA